MSAAVYYPEEVKNLPSLVEIMPPNDMNNISNGPINQLGLVQQQQQQQPPHPPPSTNASTQGNTTFSYQGPDRCTCKSNHNRIPRPRNAFILFRQKYHQSVLDEGTVCRTNPEVSRELGKRWRQLSSSEKEYWNNLAEEEKVSHAKKYPGYRYTPRRNGKNKNCDYCRLKQMRQQPRSQSYDYLMMGQVSKNSSAHSSFSGQGNGVNPYQQTQAQMAVPPQQASYVQTLGIGIPMQHYQSQGQQMHQPLGMSFLPQSHMHSQGMAQGMAQSSQPNINGGITSSQMIGGPVGGQSNTHSNPGSTASTTPQSQTAPHPQQPFVTPYVQYIPYQQPNFQVAANYGDNLGACANEQKLSPLSAPTSEYDQRYYVPTMDVNYQI